MTISLSGSQNLMKLNHRAYREPDKALKWPFAHRRFAQRAKISAAR